MAQRIKEISDIYDSKLKQVKEPKEWEKALKNTSKFWRLSFCEAMLLLEQNPHAKMCGTLAQWNNIGRFVNRGERSVAVFKHRTDTQLLYLFDVSQTYGKGYNGKWKMTENIADGIVGKYNSENEEQAVSLEDYLQKSIDKHIEIVYNYNGEINTQIFKDPRILRFIRESVECICMTRCGIDKDYDFSETAHFSDDVAIIEMGNAASTVAQEVLREVDGIIRRKEYELYRAAICGRHLRYSLRGGQERTEKSDVSELRQSANDANGAQGGGLDERNRPDSTRLGEYERTVSDDMERNRTEGGGYSYASNGEPVENNNVEQEIRGTSETARGNRADSERGGLGGSANERELAVTGSSQTAETKTHKENSSEHSELTDNYLDISEDEDEDEEEIYDETVSDDDTVSYFSDTPVNVDSDTDFAQKLLAEEILHGGCYLKFRIDEYVRNENPNVSALAGFLKKEYGIGGSSRDGNPVLWQNHDAKGFCLEILSENGERQAIKYTWNKVAAAVKKAISENKYITKSDWETRTKHAKYEAEKYTLHYAYPYCVDNRRLDYIRGELKSCGIDYDISLNAEKWAVYASEYVRGVQTVKDGYKDIDRSNITVNVSSVYRYSAAVDAARQLKSDSYNGFIAICKDATSELVSHLLAKDKGFPALCYTDEEIAEFFTGNKATAEETVKEIAAQAFGYLYAVEQRDISWQNHKEQEKQKAAINNSKDDLQLTLFGNDESESVAESEDDLYNDELSTEIASKTTDIHSDEIPADIDKFYINRENETVTWIYYNPDSSAGGQFVYTYMDFDDIFNAADKEDPLEYLTENCKQTTLDIDAEGFNDAAEEFLRDSEDISSREENYVDKLLALSEPKEEVPPETHDNSKETEEQLPSPVDETTSTAIEERALKVGDVIEFDGRKYEITKINDAYDKKEYTMLDMQLTGWYPISRVIYGDELEQYEYKLLKSSSKTDEKTAEDVTAKETEEQLPSPVVEETTTNVAPVNYHFSDDFEYPKGEKGRYNANVAAIKTLKQIERQHRQATAEEQEILAHYSGWGGTANAFDETKEEWRKEYAELKDLLTEKEYKAARESTLTAFYTEPYIIKSIYKALENFGFEGGYVLEPSCATGNFFGNMPQEMAENSRLFGVELDSLSARIAKQLYPNAEIQNTGFENTKFENDTFDVVVGNVPFGNFAPYDESYDDEYLIHDYFFKKSLDNVSVNYG